MLRYKGTWYSIKPKQYEPEQQTIQVAWALVKDPNATPETAYIKYFEKLRKQKKILYHSFRKDKENDK